LIEQSMGAATNSDPK